MNRTDTRYCEHGRDHSCSACDELALAGFPPPSKYTTIAPPQVSENSGQLPAGEIKHKASPMQWPDWLGLALWIVLIVALLLSESR